MLHVVELRHALRRSGKAVIADNVRNQLAVDPDLATVAQ
jgi:hypothetical protein